MSGKFNSLFKARNSYFTNFFRIRITVVVLSLLILIGIVIGLVFISSRHEDEQNYIVNILGRQKMLTQKIVKDVNLLSALYEAIESSERISSIEQLMEKTSKTRKNLMESRESFDETYQQIKQGKISFYSRQIILYSPSQEEFKYLIKDIEREWMLFEAEVFITIEKAMYDKEFRKALIYINENNESLLDLSEKLSALVLHNFYTHNHRTHVLVIFLIICLVFLSLWILFGTYQFIIEPYKIFYNGIKTLGIAEENKKNINNFNSPLIQEVNQTFAVLREMVNIIGTINQGSSFRETLHLVFKTFINYIPFNYIGVTIFDGYSGNILIAPYGESDGSFPDLPERLMNQSVNIEETSLKKIIISNQPRIINDLQDYAGRNEIKEYTKIILEEGILSSITLPLIVNGKPLGFLFFSSKERNIYTDMHLAFLRNISNAIALSFEKNIFVDELVYSSTLALAKMAEARDEDTADHLDRMKQYTVQLARCMKEEHVYDEQLTPEYIHGLERFSPMHDIGKVGIRDNVLLKPGKLNEEEMAHMKTHALYGANVLKEAENNIARSGRTLFQIGIRIAASHHEKWNGSGYPSGLAGLSIPLEARIVAIADVLDALTTRRPYKEAFDFDISVRMIIQNKGSHFDPEIIGVFEHHVEKFQELYNYFKKTVPENY